MPGITPARTRAAALLVVGVIALALAGCNKPGQVGVDTTSSGDSQIGGNPSETPPATSTPSPPSSTPAGPLFPNDAKSYGFELFKAWAGPNYNRIGELADSSTVQQIKDSITYGGNVNSSWTYIRCGAAEVAGYTDCTYRNAHGDEAKLRFKNSALGGQHAVTGAPLERTQYSNDPGTYAAYFMSAWNDGNQQRMARYSSSSIKNYFIGQNPPMSGGASQNTPEDIGGGYVKVEFDGLGPELGRSYTLKILANPDNKAFAIKGYCKGGGCTP